MMSAVQSFTVLQFPHLQQFTICRESRGGREQRIDTSGAQPMASMQGWARPPAATCTLPMLVTRNVAHTVIIQFLSCRDDTSYLTILQFCKVPCITVKSSLLQL